MYFIVLTFDRYIGNILVKVRNPDIQFSTYICGCGLFVAKSHYKLIRENFYENSIHRCIRSISNFEYLVINLDYLFRGISGIIRIIPIVPHNTSILEAVLDKVIFTLRLHFSGN